MTDEIDLAARKGFSAEVLADCAPPSPYHGWLQQARRSVVPQGEFWFYVNNITPGANQAAAIKSRLGPQGQSLTVRLIARLNP